MFPKLGSTYTYDLYQTDSIGDKVPGSDTTIVATVISTDLNYLGKSKVFQVEDGGATNFHTFEQNGDLSISLDTTNGPGGGGFPGITPPTISQWFTFFTGSKIKGDLQVFDSSIAMSIPGSPVPITIEIKAVTGYIGEEAVIVGSESLACSKIHVKFTVTALGTPITTTDQVYWFCPKLGYFAKEQTISGAVTIPIIGLNFPASGSVQILTSYHLN